MMDSLASSSPVYLALLGTLFTWGVTALGAAVVFVLDVFPMGRRSERLLLDASLGFSAGVMLAASYWSLLAPAIEQAQDEGYGDWSFLPAMVGFLMGGLALHVTDGFIRRLTKAQKEFAKEEEQSKTGGANLELDEEGGEEAGEELESDEKEHSSRKVSSALRKRQNRQSRKPRSRSKTRLRKGSNHSTKGKPKARKRQEDEEDEESAAVALAKARSWRRILLLVVAITLHNAPEGAAVGVGFGALGSASSTEAREKLYAQARNLAVGIGLQNFPEGLAVSLPLRRAGFSGWTAFFFGQLSGAVEPVAGILGAYAIALAQPLLPYALAFAAGAMVFVVVDDILPETFAGTADEQRAKIVTWGVMVGFSIMMSMDVALG